jgi:hypothetical protein
MKPVIEYAVGWMKSHREHVMLRLDDFTDHRIWFEFCWWPEIICDFEDPEHLTMYNAEEDDDKIGCIHQFHHDSFGSREARYCSRPLAPNGTFFFYCPFHDQYIFRFCDWLRATTRRMAMPPTAAPRVEPLPVPAPKVPGPHPGTVGAIMSEPSPVKLVPSPGLKRKRDVTSQDEQSCTSPGKRPRTVPPEFKETHRFNFNQSLDMSD